MHDQIGGRAARLLNAAILVAVLTVATLAAAETAALLMFTKGTIDA